jgi:sensor histidine kinase regulating citrate/malate metabolism
LITSTVGELDNNSFDHNLGLWPDFMGIFFTYDLNKRKITLADRGQGILTTLSRVLSELKNDETALLIAFTEKISGRASENRGNGLKYVKNVVRKIKKDIPLELYFQSRKAYTKLKINDTLKIKTTTNKIKGCLTLINF